MRLVLALLAVLLMSMPVTADWIDPDTPWEARTTQRMNMRPPPPYHEEEKPRRRHKGNSTTLSPYPTVSPAPSHAPTMSPTFHPTYDATRTFELVFSDEFNTPHRSFQDGTDPRWTALDKNDYTNDALHYYSPDNVWTNQEGHLVIRSEAKDTDIVGFNDVKGEREHVTKHFRSGMVQSWNKFCFTGGIVEAQVVLPGKARVGGLWPAFWLLGNLARHTYVGSSEHIWPWSSVSCNRKFANAQRMSGCDRVAHFGFEPGVGRGAPEMDIFEVQPGNIRANQKNFLKSSVGQPYMSASFQVAPGRPSNRPGPGEWPGPGQWYDGLTGGMNTSLNILFYGAYNHFLSDVNPAKEDYWSDGISFNRQLDEDYFTNPHVYRLEWDVPTEDRDGYLHWFLDGELVLAINGTGIKAAGLGSEVSTEPSYIIFNTAISKQWGFPSTCPANCPCKTYDCHSTTWASTCGFSSGFCDMMKASEEEAPQYKIDWVRVYQDPNDSAQKVGCSTPERPTRRFIEAHEKLYKTEDDLFPLRGIQRGDGVCDPAAIGVVPQACGGNQRGRCTPGKVCECMPGWTGPHCLAHQGSDPTMYDQPDKITDVGFIPPKVAPTMLVVGLGCLIALLIVTLQFQRRFDGWTPIPDISTAEVKEYGEKAYRNAAARMSLRSRRGSV